MENAINHVIVAVTSRSVVVKQSTLRFVPWKCRWIPSSTNPSSAWTASIMFILANVYSLLNEAWSTSTSYFMYTSINNFKTFVNWASFLTKQFKKIIILKPSCSQNSKAYLSTIQSWKAVCPTAFFLVTPITPEFLNQSTPDLLEMIAVPSGICKFISKGFHGPRHGLKNAWKTPLSFHFASHKFAKLCNFARTSSVYCVIL